MKSLLKLSILQKPERIFLIISSLFGLLSIFMMPVLTIPDEGAHFWMSYGMFSKYKQIPTDLLISAEDSVKYVKDGTYIEKIFVKKADLKGDVFQFNYAQSITINSANDNRPVSSLDFARLPQALGVVLGKIIYPSIGIMVILGRILNLAVYITTIYFIIKKVRYGKLALTFLALFPMLIHQAGSLSYDVINIVVVFAWVGLMINLFSQAKTLTRRQLTVTILLSIALLLTKPTNALLFLFLPLLPTDTYKNSGVFKKIQKNIPKFSINHRILWVLIGVLGLILTIALGYLFDKYLNSHGIGLHKFIEVFFDTFFRPEVNTQLDPIVTTGIVGNFGWLWYRLPEWLVFIHLSIFSLILLGDKVPKVSPRFALISVCLFTLSIIAITLGMYFLWTLDPKVIGPGATFIQGMQGRYFTPLLILLIPVFAYLQRYVTLKIDQKLLTLIATSMSIFTLCVYIVLTYFFFY